MVTIDYHWYPCQALTHYGVSVETNNGFFYTADTIVKQNIDFVLSLATDSHYWLC